MWMKQKFLIPALIVLVVIALLVYFFWRRRTSSDYTLGAGPLVTLKCSFTTPSSFGHIINTDGSVSQDTYDSIVAYIIDCGTDACVPSNLPVNPSDDELTNQKFIKLSDINTIVPDDSTNLSKVDTSVTLTIKNTGGTPYTINHNYAVGIAIKNKTNGLLGDFIYGTALLTSSNVPVTYSSLGPKTACRSNVNGNANPADFKVASGTTPKKTLLECQADCTNLPDCKGVSFVSDSSTSIDPGTCYLFVGANNFSYAPYPGDGNPNEQCWVSSSATTVGRPVFTPSKKPGSVSQMNVAFNSSVTPGPPAPSPSETATIYFHAHGGAGRYLHVNTIGPDTYTTGMPNWEATAVQYSPTMKLIKVAFDKNGTSRTLNPAVLWAYATSITPADSKQNPGDIHIIVDTGTTGWSRPCINGVSKGNGADPKFPTDDHLPGEVDIYTIKNNPSYKDILPDSMTETKCQ